MRLQDQLELRQKNTERQVQTVYNAVLGAKRPNSRKQPPKAEFKIIKEIRGGMLHPRPTIEFEDGDEVNVWNYWAPIGNAVGNWKPGDSIALTRNVGGNGIDPDRLTNMNQYNSDKDKYESVNGNRRGNPCKMQ